MTGYSLASSSWDAAEVEALKRVIESNQYTMGAEVRSYEQRFADELGSRYAVMTSSGSAANLLMTAAMFYTKDETRRLARGDEVIVPAIAWSTSYFPLQQYGLKLIFVDIDQETLNFDLVQLRHAINENTKAVLAVNLLGNPNDFSAINEMLLGTSAVLLEDNCESIGGKYENKFLGNIGDIGILSLDFGKTITTGEGGMILTNNAKFYNYCKQYHDHGHKNVKNLSRGNDKVSMAGFNYRMTELQGAIGKVQLKKLNFLLKDNQKKFMAIKNNIKRFEHRWMTKNGKSNFDNFIFYVKNKDQKKQVLKILKKYKIGTKNLPDAIKWHCAFYWSHIFYKKDLKKIHKTKKILDNAIAIPIFFKKSLSFYQKLSFEINKIV